MNPQHLTRTPNPPVLASGHRYALNANDHDNPYTVFGELMVAALQHDFPPGSVASVFGVSRPTVAKVQAHMRARMRELRVPIVRRELLLYDHGRSARIPDSLQRITRRSPTGSPKVFLTPSLLSQILSWHVTLGRPLTDACRKHIAPLFTALLPSIYMPTPKTLDEVVAIVERSLRADYAKELAMHKPGTHYEPPPLAPVARPAPTNPEIAEQLADLF